MSGTVKPRTITQRRKTARLAKQALGAYEWLLTDPQDSRFSDYNHQRQETLRGAISLCLELAELEGMR